jgi:hypothetical protein
MRSDLDVKVTAGIGIFVFLALLIFKGTDVFKDIVSVASTAISITVFVRYLFVKWIWKYPVIRFLEPLHKVPIIEGEWAGEIESTGNLQTPSDRNRVTVSVKIRQPDIHTVRVIRSSDESSSRSFNESIEVFDDGSTVLTYSYRSEPIAAVRDRSPISYGTAKLTLRRESPLRLEGDYWTDQKTTGRMSITRAT